MYNPIRAGTRGGQGDFTWAQVSADKDRENYLGHSINAPTGRWQKNKDVHWYNRDQQQSEEDRLEELRKIKEAEEDALAIALGFKPNPRTGASGEPSGSGNPNAIPVAPKQKDDEEEKQISKEEKRRLKEEKRAAKEERRARKERDRAERAPKRHHHRHPSDEYDRRSRSPAPSVRNRRDYHRSRSPPRRLRSPSPSRLRSPGPRQRRLSPPRRRSPSPARRRYVEDDTPPRP